MKERKGLNVLVDSIIVVDVFLNQYSVDESIEILSSSKKGIFRLFLTSNTLSLVYAMIKTYHENLNIMDEFDYTWKLCMETIQEVFCILHVSEEDCANALQLGWTNYNHAIEEVCGQRNNMDIYLTRDSSFNLSKLMVLQPFEFYSTHLQ